MCSRAVCRSCHRPTYRGCGNHVEQVLADVPPAERCQCAATAAASATPRVKRSWLGRRR